LRGIAEGGGDNAPTEGGGERLEVTFPRENEAGSKGGWTSGGGAGWWGQGRPRPGRGEFPEKEKKANKERA